VAGFSFSDFGFSERKKQVFEKLELQTGTGKAHFTIVGVSFGRKLVEVFGWSAEQSNKASQKQVIT
jgi:hypothetical protein